MTTPFSLLKAKRENNTEIDELKKELLNLRKDYDVEIKAMFLELNRVKDELSQLKETNDKNDKGNKNSNQGYHDNPLHGNRQASGFEMKPPNARYRGNKKDELQYAEGNNSSLGSSLFEYSSRSRIYGD